MKIALVPLNPTVGDVPENAEKIFQFLEQAINNHCELIIFPELALVGYPLKDLIFYDLILERQNQVLSKLQRFSKKIAILVGGVAKNKGPGKPFYNAAYLFKNGQKFVYKKRLLPNYDVFDEERYFEPGEGPLTFKLGGQKFAVTICEDIWFYEEHLQKIHAKSLKTNLIPKNIDFLINLSASPYEFGKEKKREDLLQKITKDLKIGLIYINQMGANDDLIFDGKVYVFKETTRIDLESKGFTEGLLIYDTKWNETSLLRPARDDNQKNSIWEDLHQALVMGIRDYVRKSDFSKVILGLSGGIDSALVAQLACEALTPENVFSVVHPSRYTSPQSEQDAKKIAKTLKIKLDIIPIDPLHQLYEKTLQKVFPEEKIQDLTNQNLQARLRGNLLMALSNQRGQLLLNTTNKSEMAMGYGTLYGDMCGALAVLSDLTKEKIYALARHLNPKFEIIPKSVITKVPSAELKPHQKDSDTLPEYKILDPLLETWIEKEEVYEKDLKKNKKTLLKKMLSQEYKRKQAPVGLKVTAKAFGSGRRYPVVMKI